MDGFCSKCYKERIKTREDQQLASSVASSTTTDVTTVLGASKPIMGANNLNLGANNPNLGGNNSNLGANNPNLGANHPQSDVRNPLDIIEDDIIDNELPPSKIQEHITEMGAKSDQELTPEPQKKKRNRCDVCSKRVGLTGFTCRCKRLFCSEHQYPDEHACEIDYKKLGRDQLKKANPVVVAEKIRKL